MKWRQLYLFFFSVVNVAYAADYGAETYRADWSESTFNGTTTGRHSFSSTVAREKFHMPDVRHVSITFTSES